MEDIVFRWMDVIWCGTGRWGWWGREFRKLTKNTWIVDNVRICNIHSVADKEKLDSPRVASDVAYLDEYK